MLTEDLVQYVSDLDVQAPEARFAIFRGDETTPAVKEGEPQSFLADKSLVSFISEVSGQNRSDVLNSTLLAQMAANKKFPLESDMLQWYDAFIRVLSNIGWTVEGAGISTFESSKDVFEIEQAIIDILTTAFGGSFMPVVLKTLESIKNLGNSDHKIVAFEKNTHTMSKGCFQIALATEKNDSVSMQLGTFLLTSQNKIKKILFVKTKKDKTTLQYTSRRGTLNTEAYAMVRDAVRQKLGANISAYVAEIEI